MPDIKHIFRCYLHILSPVHLGCDEVYEPMGFIMDEIARKIIVFNPLSFISEMKEKEREDFSRICAKGTASSILDIYKFLKGKKTHGRYVDVCQGLIDHYRSTLLLSSNDERKIRREVNRFTIDRTAFQSVDQRPYIPGSAVKGAFRTAYINLLAKSKKIKGRPKHKELEKELLDSQSFENDPFRLVKVSDFKPVGQIKTRIIYAVNEKKQTSKFAAKGPYQILEVIEPGSVFTGEINVIQPQNGTGIKNPITIEKLLQSIDFYKYEKDREEKELGNIGTPAVKVMEGVRLMRIGRHSGAECLTVNGYRNIKIIRGNEKPLFTDHATTLWLASEAQKSPEKRSLRPFGWVHIDELKPDLIEKFDKIEQQWKEIEKKGMYEKISSKAESPVAIIQDNTSALEKILKEISVVKTDDMGILGNFIQKIDTLQTDADKGALAKAIKDKMSAKRFKKYKNSELLNNLICLKDKLKEFK